MPDETPQPTPSQQPYNIAGMKLPGASNSTIGDYANPQSILTLAASSSMVAGFVSTLPEGTPLWAMWLVAITLSAVIATGQVLFMSHIDGNGKKIFFSITTAIMIFISSRGTYRVAGTVAEEVSQLPAPSLVTYAYGDEIVTQVDTNAPPKPWKPRW